MGNIWVYSSRAFIRDPGLGSGGGKCNKLRLKVISELDKELLSEPEPPKPRDAVSHRTTYRTAASRHPFVQPFGCTESHCSLPTGLPPARTSPSFSDETGLLPTENGLAHSKTDHLLAALSHCPQPITVWFQSYVIGCGQWDSAASRHS